MEKIILKLLNTAGYVNVLPNLLAVPMKDLILFIYFCTGQKVMLLNGYLSLLQKSKI